MATLSCLPHLQYVTATKSPRLRHYDSASLSICSSASSNVFTSAFSDSMPACLAATNSGFAFAINSLLHSCFSPELICLTSFPFYFANLASSFSASTNPERGITAMTSAFTTTYVSPSYNSTSADPPARNTTFSGSSFPSRHRVPTSACSFSLNSSSATKKVAPMVFFSGTVNCFRVLRRSVTASIIVAYVRSARMSRTPPDFGNSAPIRSYFSSAFGRSR